MDILEARAKIDELDIQIVDLLKQRMILSSEIAIFKKENNLPIHAPSREEEILHNISAAVPETIELYIQKIYATIFETSRQYQENKQNEVF